MFGRSRLATVALVIGLGLALGSTAAAAADVEDLLFDLQLIPLDGQPAPDFTLEALDGRRVSLGQLKGQTVMLYFWATW